MDFLIAFAVAAVGLRLATLAVSVRNERRLKAAGATEAGASNTRVLALAHTAFYLAAIAEGPFFAQTGFDWISAVGLVVYGFGIISLFAVLQALGSQWTVKLIISPAHSLVRTGIYRFARHPNYFWNILPELAGFALVLHAYGTLLVGLPLYLIPLTIRIRQENLAMKTKFANY